MSNSLWGEEFSVKETPQDTKKIIDKINNPKLVEVSIEKRLNKKSISISEKLSLIYSEVNRILGHYKEDTQVIKTREEFHNYITDSINNGIIAIDTETNNSLDPITCKIMGLCIYTPNRKNAYIPINHVELNTRKRLEWQLTEQDIKEELERIKSLTILMHNGKFDYQVLKCTCGIECIPTWDTMIAFRLLDENEKSVKLKDQYIAKIDSSQEKYSIEHLFNGVEYAIVDPSIFALYAATDSFMTFKLYEWQKKRFEIAEHRKLYNLFKNIEMPIVQVAAEMELVGVEVDKEYAKRLSDKYHKLSSDMDANIYAEINKYSDVIAKWRLSPEANVHEVKSVNGAPPRPQKSKNEQLQDPILLSSTQQLAILLYDILKVPVVDKKQPRGTGEDILKKIDNPICKLILEKRGVEKLISTYIDTLPNMVSKKDNRLHGHYNQLGTDTGRFSSTEPNLQNIPSHNKEIRMMFKASEGHSFVSADYSQQEPRLLSAYSKDEAMIQAYKDNKDLYAMIASKIYHNNYEDNKEFYPDGTKNDAGAKRRSDTKQCLLGIMYGLGASSLAEKIKSTTSEAQKIIDDFYAGFPSVKKWMSDTDANAKKYGYVEDFWGRRRRLPDIQREKYELSDGVKKTNFNPILFTKGIINEDNPKIKKYKQLLDGAKSFKEVTSIKQQAEADGITVKDNSGFISRAERQCVNARVQGGAASMTKIAMRKIFDNQELRNLGFKLVLQIHDEVIGEVPNENAERASELLSDIMKNAVADTIVTPFKCDAEIAPCWYYNDYKAHLKDEYNNLLKTSTPKDALYKIVHLHSECTNEQILEFLGNEVAV